MDIADESRAACAVSSPTSICVQERQMCPDCFCIGSGKAHGGAYGRQPSSTSVRKSLDLLSSSHALYSKQIPNRINTGAYSVRLYVMAEHDGSTAATAPRDLPRKHTLPGFGIGNGLKLANFEALSLPRQEP